jgi:hypothetical protein
MAGSRIVTAAEADIAGGEIEAGGGRFGRVLMSTPFLGSIVALATWPIMSIVPSTGTDPSWMAGLQMAYGDGAQFGKDFVFTYGPFGFLQAPVLYDETLWIAAFLYRSFIQFAVAISLLWVARRAFPLSLALIAAYVLLVIGYLEGAVVLLGFIWCFVALSDRRPRLAVPLVVFGGGLVGAIELLGKVNYGVAVLAFCFITLLGLPGRRRNVGLFAVTVGAAFVGLWLVARQDLSNLPDLATSSLQLMSGYSRSMSSGVTTHDWELSVAIVGMALLLGGAVLATWRDDVPRRLASVALVAVFTFLVFKEGFVRQGLGNTSDFFVFLACGGIAVASRIPAVRIGRPHRVLAVAFTVPFVAVALMALPTVSLWRSLKPDHHTAFLRRDIKALLSPAARAQLLAEGRKEMQRMYRIDPGILEALGGRSVHIDPSEIGVAWAYGLNWHPLPVIQAYSAYTPELDALNAEALSGPDGPEAILRPASGNRTAGPEALVDDRLPGWDSPAASRSMLCHYRSVRVISGWQLLERIRDRCGPTTEIGATWSTTGRRIRIPRPPDPDQIVFARVEGLGVEGWEALRANLYRARQRSARFDDGRSWKLIAETAGDGLLMSAPSTIDYPGRFRLAPNSGTVSFGLEGDVKRSLRIRFFAQQVKRISPAGR